MLLQAIWLSKKLDYMIDELEICQNESGNGYLWSTKRKTNLER
jgi:hypothetical protein